MTSIVLKVEGAQAWASVTGPLTSGMVGIPITIEYDEAWEGLTRNLVCRCSNWGKDGGVQRAILNVGSTAVVAHEVMQAGMHLYVGLEGFSSDGKLVIPTTWAMCGVIHNGANTGADLSEDPTLPIWNQLQAQIEQLECGTFTQEQMAEVRACAEAATQAASEAAREKENAVAASELAADNANTARIVANAAQMHMESARTSATSAAYMANNALQYQQAAETAAVRAENAVAASQYLKPISKTEDMTQPVGVDGDGKLWTAPTAGGGGEEEVEDILLGTLPMTISERNCYLLAQTNATISTGEGAVQLLDFDVNEPYIGATTYNGGTVEKLGKNTVKVGFANTAKNAMVHFPTACEVGKTYTVCAKLLSKSDDVADASSMPVIRIQQKNPDTGAVDVAAQLSVPATGDMGFKTFDVTENTLVHDAQISFVTKSSYIAGETYVTIVLYLYEGTYTELPAGTTFDIIAGEKYNTDGYMGATLSAVSGGPVEVYQVNTSGAEAETDSGGVIFFGDSILDYSDVITRYAAKTGKSVIDCAVGGTRMSASRDSSNAYYPVDMANIADAIASGDFSAQLGSGVATAGFTTLASANIANYKAMILEFGANDFTAKVPFDGENVTSIKGAIKHILRTILTKYPDMRIVVLSTLQYVTLGTGTESGVPTHDDGTVWEMNEVIRDVCQSDEFCVPWVDMYHAFGQNGITRNTLTSDGCHLTSPNGAKRYADILTAKLNGLGI